jgi:predicted secreted protein
LHALNAREGIIIQLKTNGIHLRSWSLRNTAGSVIFILSIEKQNRDNSFLVHFQPAGLT